MRGAGASSCASTSLTAGVHRGSWPHRGTQRGARPALCAHGWAGGAGPGPWGVPEVPPSLILPWTPQHWGSPGDWDSTGTMSCFSRNTEATSLSGGGGTHGPPGDPRVLWAGDWQHRMPTSVPQCCTGMQRQWSREASGLLCVPPTAQLLGGLQGGDGLVPHSQSCSAWPAGSTHLLLLGARMGPCPLPRPPQGSLWRGGRTWCSWMMGPKGFSGHSACPCKVTPLGSTPSPPRGPSWGWLTPLLPFLPPEEAPAPAPDGTMSLRVPGAQRS